MGFDLLNYAKQCHVADLKQFQSRTALLYELLVNANKEFNLTRITELESFNIKHVADSLSLVKEFPKLAESAPVVADIGCGAGFPSLVLAMGFPRWKIYAIDSTGKKIAFVTQAAQTLQLNNIFPIQGRAVELNRKEQYAHRFDIVTARAVAASPLIARDCTNFLKPEGEFIFYKTPEQAQAEMAELQKSKLYWHTTTPFELPKNSGNRLFVVGSKR